VRGDRALADQAAGKRLQRAIHVARARANILYDTELAIKAGVSYDTLMNWYGGKTVPRGVELRRVATFLGIKYADLMAAYEGTDPEPPELTEVIRELVDELRLSRAQQDEATMAILRALGASARQGPTPPGTSDDSAPATPAGTRQ